MELNAVETTPPVVATVPERVPHLINGKVKYLTKNLETTGNKIVDELVYVEAALDREMNSEPDSHSIRYRLLSYVKRTVCVAKHVLRWFLYLMGLVYVGIQLHIGDFMDINSFIALFRDNFTDTFTNNNGTTTATNDGMFSTPAMQPNATESSLTTPWSSPNGTDVAEHILGHLGENAAGIVVAAIANSTGGAKSS